MRTRLTAFLCFAIVLTLACSWRADTANSKPPASSTSATASPAGQSPRSATTPITDADFARHVAGLKARIKTKLGSDEFSIVIQKPFVVVGDEPEAAVRERSTGTIKWAVDRLKQDFFTKDPSDILEIWLFKDEFSYRRNAQLLFGRGPSTPYGYYSSANKALVMNIATGGGTLVHEIVHPFIEANFPSCPAWLNEGLGSLYEQCGEVEGRIHGYTNWRLPGLQRAIRGNTVPSFKALMEMGPDTFYNDDRGTNYAQSRYLCYYLQQKGLLVKFYQEFVKNQNSDPSGFKTLQRVLGEPDMDVFKTNWEKFVLGLRQGYEVTVE